jgi:hypothetical protein
MLEINLGEHKENSVATTTITIDEPVEHEINRLLVIKLFHSVIRVIFGCFRTSSTIFALTSVLL